MSLKAYHGVSGGLRDSEQRFPGDLGDFHGEVLGWFLRGFKAFQRFHKVS